MSTVHAPSHRKRAMEPFKSTVQGLGQHASYLLLLSIGVLSAKGKLVCADVGMTWKGIRTCASSASWASFLSWMGSLALLPGPLPPLLDVTPLPDELLTCTCQAAASPASSTSWTAPSRLSLFTCPGSHCDRPMAESLLVCCWTALGGHNACMLK